MTARLLPIAAAFSLVACVSSPPSIEAPTSPPPAAAADQPGGQPGEPPGVSPVRPAIEGPGAAGAQQLPPEIQAALAQQALEEANIAVVTAFYELVFRDHRVSEAFDRYAGEGYIQHSPGLPDGRDAIEASLIPYFEDNPLASSEIKRIVAQGDLVVLHVHAKSDPVDRGRAVVEIFRVEDGRIVEHWDVIQTIPASAANENSMF